MKTLIILLLISVNAFASTHKEQPNNKLKWLKLGYEVARAHAPDYDIVEHIVAEKCEEAEKWVQHTERGEFWDKPPVKGYEITKYWEGNKLKTVHWRCTKELSRG